MKEMPKLESHDKRHRARGVEVAALCEDRLGEIDDVHNMGHPRNMQYAVAMAHKVSQNSFGDPASLPVSYVLDASGSVRAQVRPDTPPTTEENLAPIVDPVLAAP